MIFNLIIFIKTFFYCLKYLSDRVRLYRNGGDLTSQPYSRIDLSNISARDYEQILSKRSSFFLT